MDARRLALACIVAVVLAGCGSGSKRLQGTWTGVRSEGVAPSAAAQGNAFARAMQLDVKDDAITIVTASSMQSSHYQVIKDDKTTLVIATDKDGPSELQTFTFVDENTLKWGVLPGQSIVFTRL